MAGKEVSSADPFLLDTSNLGTISTEQTMLRCRSAYLFSTERIGGEQNHKVTDTATIIVTLPQDTVFHRREGSKIVIYTLEDISELIFAPTAITLLAATIVLYYSGRDGT